MAWVVSMVGSSTVPSRQNDSLEDVYDVYFRQIDNVFERLKMYVSAANDWCLLPSFATRRQPVREPSSLEMG
jgi:hypothetical protein